MLIFRLKKQLYLFQIVLFSFLGLILIANNHQVMATGNNNSKGKLKKDIDIVEETLDTLEESIDFFNKKGIQINLKNKLSKLFSNDKKRNTSTQNISSTSKPNKKKK